jgi:nitrite reductase (NADH) large subunit
LKAILLDDSEGICAELDARMQDAVDAYVDPWLEAVVPANPTQFSSVVAAGIPVSE